MPNLRLLALICVAMLASLLAGCASSTRNDALYSAQYAWSAAIRWGDFEGAWNMVDPDIREKNPVSELQFERYRQVRISSYRDLGAQVRENSAVREVQLGVINTHTMAERTVRYSEQWRYDPAAKAWWVTSGLPDLWAGE